MKSEELLRPVRAKAHSPGQSEATPWGMKNDGGLLEEEPC